MRNGKIYELIERLNVATNRLDGAYYIWARRHNVKENIPFLITLHISKMLWSSTPLSVTTLKVKNF